MRDLFYAILFGALVGTGVLLFWTTLSLSRICG